MSGSGRWWWYTSNMRWPELDLSPPWTVLRWPAVDLSYWWVNFSVVDDVLWGFVTVLESVALVAMLCYFFLCCGCTL
ncbi:hypothetical protein S83_046694 [Arachis hypogaea]